MKCLMKCLVFVTLGLAALGLLGCSSSGNTDARPPTEFGFIDGFGTPWPCDNPGGSCISHSPCVEEAMCGDDHLCHPTKTQNCDDGLPCTTDICKGSGICSNVPKAGTCALPVKVVKDGVTTSEQRCFNDGDKNPSDPCQVCSAAGDGRSGTEWAPASGGTCDDKNNCTKNDYCQDGVCKGEDYSKQCADKFSCTEDLCDGNGGCGEHKLRPDWCIINDVCYSDQQQDDTGCKICDVKTSQSAWTPLAVKCQIAGKCYKPGQKDVSGCAECDPAKNPNNWTVTAGSCVISGTCYKSGDKDSTGCLSCDPTKSATAWTAIPDTCKINNTCYKAGAMDTTGCGVCDPASSTTAWTVKGQSCLIGKSCFANLAKDTSGCRICDVSKSKISWSAAPGVIASSYTFEDGKTPPAGWTITNTSTTIGWIVTNRRAGQGSYSLYYGDPATGTFDSGTANSGNADMPAVTLTAGKKAGLAFWIYLDTEAFFPLAPVFEVQVNGTTVWSRTSTFVMREWQEVFVDLTTYAGKLVKVRFRLDTSKSMFNFGEGVFLDAVTIFHNC